MSSARRTYDTDSIVLRRVFAYDISNNTTFSTGYVLTSIGGGPASFVSPFVSLSTIGYLNLPANVSTLAGELYSTVITFAPTLPSSPQVFLPSTVIGLGTSGYVSTSQLVSSIAGLDQFGFIVEPELTSSLVGLGTLGYISSLNPEYISTGGLASTVEGLGTSGYVSTSWLNSTIAGLGQNYISSAVFLTPLNSTITGLGTAGYVSTASLYSTIEGLGSAGYLSTPSPIYRSTYSNLLEGNWYSTSFLYYPVTSFVNTIKVDLGDSLRQKIQPGVSKLDIQFKENMQFGFYDATSGNYFISTFVGISSSLDAGDLSTTTVASETLQYYILNSNIINFPFTTQESFRFIFTDSNTLNTIKTAPESNLYLWHYFTPQPVTNQFFASPSYPGCVYVVLDNTLS